MGPLFLLAEAKLLSNAEGRKPKVFILGISGFLGYHLALRLREKFLVAGACFSHHVTIPDVQTFSVDLSRPEFLEAVVRIQAPSFIINAMGISNRQYIADNPKVADNVNIMLPVSYAILANKMRAQFLHLSCAEVFEGSDGPHREDGYRFAMHDSFGKQKIAAETYIKAQTLESTILRVGRVLGLGNPYRINEFDRARATLAAKKTLLCSKGRTYSYLSVESFTQAVEQVLLSEFAGKHRLLHLGGANLPELAFYAGFAEMAFGNSQLIKANQDDHPANFGLVSDAFAKTYPAWKPETPGELYLNLLKALCPGVGIRKWQKTLRTP